MDRCLYGCVTRESVAWRHKKKGCDRGECRTIPDCKEAGWTGTYVVVEFYHWFKFYFPLFLGMVMYQIMIMSLKQR